MAAQYIVTIPPGIPVKSVGFVRPGEKFHAPADKDWLPSRTFRAANEEAVQGLKALQAKLLEAAKEVRSRPAEDPAEKKAYAQAARAYEYEAKAINLQILKPQVEQPKIEPGVPINQLEQEGRSSGKRMADK